LAIAIPEFSKIEVFKDSSPLDLDKLPTLTGGEKVSLEVIAFDAAGKRYTSDDLVCKWSVNPLSEDDQGIGTELCNTFYIPSRRYPSQTVEVEVQDLEQHFKPIKLNPLNFDIVTK
jgi:hypothetical protein